jgi:hypothetical protein
VGGAGFVYQASATEVGPTQSTQVTSNYGWVGGAGAVSNETVNSILFSGMFQVSNNQDVPIVFQQGITCGNGVDCDFQNTAQLSLVLPPGVTYTSDSGVFLSQSVSTPEPGSAVLLGAVLLALGGYRFYSSRRRRA